jgi:hypothetical protein
MLDSEVPFAPFRDAQLSRYDAVIEGDRLSLINKAGGHS